MDAMTLVARLTLDSKDYDKGLDNAKSSASSFGEKVTGGFGSIASGIGNVAKVAAGAATAALGAATTGVAAITKAAVSSYAEYEQLVGGVQKLYGNMGQGLEEYAKSQGKTTAEVKTQWEALEKAQTTVLNNANNAYKTAGMSANQYMETATSFSAALVNSLGGDTVAAANATDKAMSAISDNVNTFGSDMDSVTNAFQGFAKQNYTMLDNLKLGYGGTKEGMQQLIDDANEYAKANGQAADLSIDSFADIVEAIDLVQQKQNIAGTTAREAMTTIEGSAAATKAAWANVLSAIAGGGDLGSALDGLITSVFGEGGDTGLLNQVLPRIQTTFEGIGDFIAKASPYISEKLPELVSAVVPSLVSCGAELLGAIGEGLLQTAPTLLQTASDLFGMLIDGLSSFNISDVSLFSDAAALIGNFAEQLSAAIPTVIPIAIDLVTSFISEIGAHAGDIASTATTIINNLVNGLISAIPSISAALPELINAAVEMGNAIVEALPEIIQGLLDALPTAIDSIISGLVECIPTLVDGAISLVDGLVAALPTIIQSLVNALPSILDSLITGLLTAVPQLIDGIIQLNLAIVAAMPTIIQCLIEAIPSIIETLVSAIVENGPQFLEAVTSIITSIGEYIGTSASTFVGVVTELGGSVLASLGSWLAELPTTLAYWAGRAIGMFYTTFTTLPEKIGTAVTDGITKVKEWGAKLKEEVPKIAKQFVDDMHTKLNELPGKIKQVGLDMVTSLWNGIKEKWDWLKSQVSNLAASLVKGAQDQVNKGKGAEGGEGGEGEGGGEAAATSALQALSAGYSFNSIVGTNSGAALALAGGGTVDYSPNVNVYLQGDAARIFKVVKTENNRQVKRTGNGL